MRGILGGGWSKLRPRDASCSCRKGRKQKPCRNSNQVITLIPSGIKPKRLIICARRCASLFTVGTVAKLAMRQPFVLFKGLTFQK
ncbi:TPA: hypothetical protein MG545_23875, partial [Klebsiella pneumoniae]|nr:hypothetical protein [Klebsiella pneumoniae]